MRRRNYSSSLGFTSGQQGEYRPMVAAAWQRHSQLSGLPPDPFDDKHPSHRAWYEDELDIATGKSSTRFCDRKRDFEAAMQHFERLSESGIYWALRVYGADARRIAYNIREITHAHEVDEDYMRRMARRSLGLTSADPLPDLANFGYEQIIVMMGEVKRFLRRGGRPGRRETREPF